MILLYFALITLQSLMAEAAAIAAGFVITIRLSILFTNFIRSLFDEE